MRKKANYNQKIRDWYIEFLKDLPISEKIARLKIAERQKYNYYCDCSDRWTTEQCAEYESQWNEIIDLLIELDEEQKGRL